MLRVSVTMPNGTTRTGEVCDSGVNRDNIANGTGLVVVTLDDRPPLYNAPIFHHASRVALKEN